MTHSAAELGRRAEAMIDELAAISEEPDRLTRRFLTLEHKRAARLVGEWMAEAGMDVRQDALGTVIGRFEPKGAARPRLLLGSHIDSVVNAGRYDGTLGVIAGILAVETLKDRLTSLPIDVIAFGDEEGSRFPTTLSTSMALAGHFDAKWLDVVDRDGISFTAAMRAHGLDPERVAACAYRREDVAAYFEVHIEQGPVLEAASAPLGVVTSIAGQYRSTVTVEGVAGHAGTTPMGLRKDALAAACEMALAAEAIAKENAAAAMVATVGRMEVSPGAANVIPDRVMFTLDLRADSDAPRFAAQAEFVRRADAIAAARNCRVGVEIYHDAPTAPCAPWIRAALAKAAPGAPELPSGAGHDGQAMSRVCDYGMLFVRSKDGISHNPAEYSSPDDMGEAIAALIRFVEALDARL